MKTQLTFDPGFDKLYNLYSSTEKGRELLEIEGISEKQLDVAAMSKAYFTEKLSDISIDQNANANEQLSANNYSAEVTKGIEKLEGEYLLWYYSKKKFGTERANELIKAIWDGDVYFHDASGAQIQIPYCWAYSTSIIMEKGRPYGQLHSLPPKRADSFIAQVIEVTMDLSQEFAGAISPSDMIVNYAWFAKKENLDDKTILNDFQKFVHVVNNQFRSSGQSPFVNISLFDRPNLRKVFDGHYYPDGTTIDIEYVIRLQEIFGEWFSKGDPATGLPYRFPVVTLNISKSDEGKIIDGNFLGWSCNVNLAKGCFNIYVNDGQKIASCCRLVNDLERMKFRMDSFGNGGLNIGSHRVVTMNLPRVGLLSAGNMEEFDKRLLWVMEVTRDLLIVHREEILQRRIDKNFLKFFKPLNWFSLDSLFSTIGILGVYEMNYFMGLDIKTKDGIAFTRYALESIEEFASKSSRITGNSFNVEEIPGESTAPRFVKKDKAMFDLDNPFELYSNQYIPLIADASHPERIELTGKFMEILSGGGILHLNIPEAITDPEIMKKLIEYCVLHGVTHIAVDKFAA